jgi:hypothetical protein
VPPVSKSGQSLSTDIDAANGGGEAADAMRMPATANYERNPDQLSLRASC